MIGVRGQFSAGAMMRGLCLVSALMAGCGDDDEEPPRDLVADLAGPMPRVATGHSTTTGVAEVPVSSAAVRPAPKPDGPLPLGSSCVTAECHGGFASAPQIHGPISAGDCSSCHADDTGSHTFPLKRQDSQLCTFCHPIEGRRAHAHRAVTQGGCLPCHRPHVSETKFLLTADSVESLCRHCHPMETLRHAHGPYAKGECTACHDPHESNASDLLRGGDGPLHCFMCHAETKHAVTNAPHVHAPAAENCLTCHSPHSSDFAHQLNAPVEELCFGCHENLEEQVRGADTPHGAVFTAERCANCHDPHAAGQRKLLRDRLDRLCLRCHDKPVGANDGRTIPDMRPSLTGRRFLHGPVESGNCAACHNAHGAGNARLLKAKFPSSFYASFNLDNYALCFQCHDPALVLEEKTTAVTGFRDGDRNLHHLHVHRDDKGRTCKTCHSIHGSDLPRHMATEVPFEGSQWAMPLGFEKTPDGGSCAPGCHQPLGYSRASGPSASTQPSTRGVP